MTDYDVVVIGAGVAGLPAGYAEHEDRPVRRMKDGSTVVVEVTFNGRTTAGRPVAFGAIDGGGGAADRADPGTAAGDTASG